MEKLIETLKTTTASIPLPEGFQPREGEKFNPKRPEILTWANSPKNMIQAELKFFADRGLQDTGTVLAQVDFHHFEEAYKNKPFFYAVYTVSYHPL